MSWRLCLDGLVGIRTRSVNNFRECHPGTKNAPNGPRPPLLNMIGTRPRTPKTAKHGWPAAEGATCNLADTALSADRQRSVSVCLSAARDDHETMSRPAYFSLATFIALMPSGAHASG